MKNTEFVTRATSEGFESLVKQWRHEGFYVFQKFVYGGDVDYAINSILVDIERGYAGYEAFETATDTDYIRTYVAVKCKVKEDAK